MLYPAIFGDSGRIRTYDQLVKSQMLYQLSYEVEKVKLGQDLNLYSCFFYL